MKAKTKKNKMADIIPDTEMRLFYKMVLKYREENNLFPGTKEYEEMMREDDDESEDGT